MFWTCITMEAFVISTISHMTEHTVSSSNKNKAWKRCILLKLRWAGSCVWLTPSEHLTLTWWSKILCHVHSNMLGYIWDRSWTLRFWMLLYQSQKILFPSGSTKCVVATKQKNKMFCMFCNIFSDRDSFVMPSIVAHEKQDHLQLGHFNILAASTCGDFY